ncbi:putative heme/steroid binding domain protein [Aspergillus saccharolyticus JOP 1030-1]|uniref:Heme/steroid binding domain protein n=1 Tax=Aspergillus saccharolyticus JOP 1030-1 TaxID=1450539 RepID=A0A318ZQQ2_9EURO|nr:heme/steroid binding domain protein [Aspergillus saccharolyticus JOP 1030-1]PYH49387.1 heme/steroid binding domain protein [Aspergillus saccharolyticus JOP 1030-1]
MSEVRQRQKPSKSSPSKAGSSSKTTKKSSSSNARGISILDIIRVLATLVIASCGLSYYMTSSESLLWGYRPWFTRLPVLMRFLQGPLTLTPAELSLYNGTDPTLPLYLSINGTIFDVSANPLVYGPGGHYNFFCGRDATRAFVTGCFQDDLTSDMTGVEEMFMPIDEPEEVEALSSGERKKRHEQDLRYARSRIERAVAHWQNFFASHKKYFAVGKVVGLDTQEGGEKRELCKAARQQRPTRKQVLEARAKEAGKK